MSRKFPQANKDLGQHFLNDPNIIRKITTDFETDAEVIVEVGCGPGVLTKHLAKSSKELILIEKDNRFSDLLIELVGEQHVFMGDALEIDLNKLVEDFSLQNKKIWWVSNLPYNISVPLLLKFLQLAQVHFMTLMFQKEVGMKVLGKDGDQSDMGSLAALVQTFFEVKQLCKAPPGAFVPPPKVHSIVLSLKRKEAPEISIQEYSKLETFLRRLFQMKRKQLQKVLRSHYPLEKLEPIFCELGLSGKERAESLNLSVIQILYKKLHE